MTTCVGIDLASEVHWICAIDAMGKILLNRELLNTPDDLNRRVEELRAMPQLLRVGIDVLDNIAALAQAVLMDMEMILVHVPWLAVKRAHQGTMGGEFKSNPRNAQGLAYHGVK